MMMFQEVQHKRKFILAGLVLYIALAGLQCAHEPSVQPAEQHGIFGSWQWIQSIGGIDGRTHTPQSDGVTKSIRLYNFHVYEMKEGNDITSTGTFSLARMKTNFSSDTVTVITFTGRNNPAPQIVSGFEDDVLILTDMCMDCFTHSYYREN